MIQELSSYFFFFNDTATTEIYTLSLHDALPIYATPAPEDDDAHRAGALDDVPDGPGARARRRGVGLRRRERCVRSEEHTSELQSRQYLVCRLLLEKKNKNTTSYNSM